MGFSLLKALFGSQPKGPEYDQKVWSSHEGKWKGVIEQLQVQIAAGKPVLLLAWFPKSLHDLEFLLTNMQIDFSKELGNANAQVAAVLADNYLKQNTPLRSNIQIWMVEHYPLHSQEVAVFQKAAQEAPNAKPIIFTSMDEHIFTLFGGERVKEMMIKMGMGKDEVIEHSMVKSSVERAQEKIAEGIISEVKTQNDEEWFLRNYTKRD